MFVSSSGLPSLLAESDSVGQQTRLLTIVCIPYKEKYKYVYLKINFKDLFQFCLLTCFQIMVF